MLSILVSEHNELRTQQVISLFSRTLSEYPSKVIECLAAGRVISYYERSINSISLVIESMREEGEDEDIIDTIESLRSNPTIKTVQEVNHLSKILVDYVRYSKLFKVKNSFIKSFDMLEDDDNLNIKETVDTIYRLSNEINNAYNVANVSSVSHTFDTNDIEAMEFVVAESQESNYWNLMLIHVDSMNISKQQQMERFRYQCIYRWKTVWLKLSVDYGQYYIHLQTYRCSLLKKQRR